MRTHLSHSSQSFAHFIFGVGWLPALYGPRRNKATFVTPASPEWELVYFSGLVSRIKLEQNQFHTLLHATAGFPRATAPPGGVPGAVHAGLWGLPRNGFEQEMP